MKKEIKSYEDLQVYQKLVRLHIEVNSLTMTFPKFELYELGSQLRRSSNAIAANIAEGWNNNHINIYLEGINRALGELRETKHHLFIACKKGYMNWTEYENYLLSYDECGKMLSGLRKSLQKYKP